MYPGSLSSSLSSTLVCFEVVGTKALAWSCHFLDWVTDWLELTSCFLLEFAVFSPDAVMILQLVWTWLQRVITKNRGMLSSMGIFHFGWVVSLLVTCWWVSSCLQGLKISWGIGLWAACSCLLGLKIAGNSLLASVGTCVGSIGKQVP